MTDHTRILTLEELISGLRELNSNLDGQYDSEDLLFQAIAYLESLSGQFEEYRMKGWRSAVLGRPQ